MRLRMKSAIAGAVGAEDDPPCWDELHQTRMEGVFGSSVFGHLADETDRWYLDLMSLEWRTADELTAICGTPMSTAYRKLNALEETGLIKGRIRVDANGKQPEEYRTIPMVIAFRLGRSPGLEISLNAEKEHIPGIDH